MPPSPDQTVPATEALRHQMERSIDELAELARRDHEGGQFFSEVLRYALQPGGAVHGTLWRLSPDEVWECAGETTSTDSHNGKPTSDRQQLLNEVARRTQPHIIRTTGTDTTKEETQIFSPLRHADQTVGILETRHAISAAENLSADTYRFFAAIGEITADYLSHQELQSLRVARSIWNQWDHLLNQLGQSSELSDVCAVLVNDGRSLVPCDRISVMVRRAGHCRLIAATGVERVDPRAGAARSLESLADMIVSHKEIVWHQEQASTSNLPSPLLDSLRRHAHSSGVTGFGAIPIFVDADSGCVAVLTFEQFQHSDAWPGLETRARTLVHRSAPILRAAIERDAIPGLRAIQALQRGPRWLRRPSLLIGFAVIAAVVVALTIIPAEFTVTGHGELWPEHRRDVFAGTSGVVDQILVNHGDEVTENQLLAVLKDPSLDQDSSRILGEIRTSTERLRGIQIARLTGGQAPDAVVRARQLTAEEEELKERLKTLERHRLLLDERRQQLNLRSPIAGRVLTWDTTQHLSARPVERGQSLLTIGETGGPWIVEVRIADKDVGHLLHAQKTIGTGLEVEFQLPSEPGRVHRGQIRNVALAVESDDRSSGFVRLQVTFDRTQVEHLRPGATAIPRIQCGREPLGYVWLHDLVDIIRVWIMF